MAQRELSENHAIEDFMKYYADAYLAYEKLSERAKQIVTTGLNELEIRHEIFVREKENLGGIAAKSPDSARKTILRRQKGRQRKYESVQEIVSEMHDLAGIRIALYYPNDFEKVQDLIKGRFTEIKPPQDWPDEQLGAFRYPSLDEGATSRSDISGRKSRFPGYFARHFRVRLRSCSINEPAIEGKTLEIQLMSLLMHTWSKMHYELIYKPRPGFPLADENDERLLDVSSGLIIAGEQLLRQIQINLDQKKKLAKIPFKDEHDAWAYIQERWIESTDKALPEDQKQWIFAGLRASQSGAGVWAKRRPDPAGTVERG